MPNTILGMRVDPARMPDVIARLETWIVSRTGVHVVTVNNTMSAVMTVHNPEFRRAINSSELSLPDGMPLVWITRQRVGDAVERVCGPELLPAFCAATSTKGYRHFFYGGAEGVPDELAAELSRSFGIQVAGTCSPPFRPLGAEEDQQMVDRINAARPDVLWVGLGCPKQEHWMHEHRDRLQVPVIIGVGQAFDIHAGRLKRAPGWMRNNGLEWLYRLRQEPRRLWRRYLFFNSQFIYYVCLEAAGWRRFE